MPITREARYLCANDLGKTVTVGSFTGTMEGLNIFTHNVTIYIAGNTLFSSKRVSLETLVTITGQSSKDK